MTQVWDDKPLMKRVRDAYEELAHGCQNEAEATVVIERGLAQDGPRAVVALMGYTLALANHVITHHLEDLVREQVAGRSGPVLAVFAQGAAEAARTDALLDEISRRIKAEEKARKIASSAIEHAHTTAGCVTALEAVVDALTDEGAGQR